MTVLQLEQRRAGVLLHPTSLPGPHGSGDFGPNAYYFVDWLASARVGLWQTLPLGPVGPGHSPYMGGSAMAGNPLLVAFEPLVAQGWLDASVLRTDWPADRVHFDTVMPWRMATLRTAYAGFEAHADAPTRQAWRAWCSTQADWLDDDALFFALDQAHAGQPWPHWPAGLARRHTAALRAARRQYAQDIDFWRFVQWQFDQQWQALRDHARHRGVQLVGDLPIFVAHHSADCWAHAGLFELDAHGWPQSVAGVPPDYFSATGQRWGNPLYDWRAMQADGYAWWVRRMRRQFDLADVVRIDHFRGFADYWAIPAQAPTAIEGEWRPGPGLALFDALRTALGPRAIIAEDLGIITDAVRRLRRDAALPGMRVLQFAFGAGADHPFLPHNYAPDTVVYVGTHDNDTVRGWWDSADAATREHAAQYLNCGRDDAHWAMLRAAWMSVANTAIVAFQDVLGLDGNHRMNTPGQMACWTWRMRWDWVGPQPAQRLAQLNTLTGRASHPGSTQHGG